MNAENLNQDCGLVVLLGAGRGGTTLLYKLLGLHRDIAYLSNYEARLPRWPGVARAQRLIRDRHALKLQTWFGADGGAYMGGPRPRFHALVPTPVECEPVYAAAGIPEEPSPSQAVDAKACARLAARMHAIRRASGGHVLVTKRTANNRRIAWLEQAFPGVRYLHLIRDGRSVAASLLKVDWWASHRLFWAGCPPTDMQARGWTPLALAAENWAREVQGIDEALAGVEQARVHTLHYEHLLESPLPVLAAALRFMGVDVDADAGFAEAIDGVGLRPARAGAPGGWSEAERSLAWSIQGEVLASHGYKP